MQNFWHEHKHFLKGLVITVAITAVVGIFGEQSGEFMASILDLEQPAPFDGTSLPVREIPDWSNLKGNEYQLLSAQLPLDKKISLPNYDPIVFQSAVADMNFSIDKEMVNKLITYAVPYMGSYESSSREYEGSHLAVDIKLPTGTDIHAIANGKVVKVSQVSSGFGKHVVIKHSNVPLVDKNETVDLYSAYAHLSETGVTSGQIVTRGEIIGKSGNSGTSTTPHLHFQIDKESAPWHPWWPFSSAEASAAGLNFFDGVSAGLNQELAIQNTINPMLWVQRYLTADNSSVPPTMHASDNTPVEEVIEPEEVVEEIIEEEEEIVAEVEEITEVEEPVITETVADASETVEAPAEETEEEIIPEEEEVVTEDPVEPIEEEVVTPDTPVESIFTDVDSTHLNAVAIKYLKEKEIIGGYDDGTFRPSNEVSRIEALKMILLGLGIELEPMLNLGFPDTSNVQWYSIYVGTALNREIAKGYPDGTFRPANTVNRAEYLKILLGSAAIAPDSVDSNPYSDVSSDAWFAPFVGYSKKKNLFPVSGSSFEGGKGVTRAEVAETIYRLMVLQKTGATEYSTDLEI